jgi:hypothetical protein
MHYIDKSRKEDELEALASLAQDERFQTYQAVVARKLEELMAQAVRVAAEPFPCEQEQNLRLVRYQAAAWVIDIPEAAVQIVNQGEE